MSPRMPEREIVKLIAALVIFIFLIVFAIQNFHEGARVRLLFWRIGRTPISIIIFVSILIGVLISIAELLPHVLRLRKRAQDAEAELTRLKTATTAKTTTRIGCNSTTETRRTQTQQKQFLVSGF